MKFYILFQGNQKIQIIVLHLSIMCKFMGYLCCAFLKTITIFNKKGIKDILNALTSDNQL